MTICRLHANPVFALLAKLAARFATERRRLERARWQAAATSILLRLDDAALRDLGLHRSEIRSAVAQTCSDAECDRLRISRWKGR